MTIFSSFSANFLYIITPSWQLTASMHQIGSFICSEHDKLMVKMTNLFLLAVFVYCHCYTVLHTAMMWGCNLTLDSFRLSSWRGDYIKFSVKLHE